MRTDTESTTAKPNRYEFTTCILYLRETLPPEQPVTGREATAEAIHDDSERRLNVFGSAGWSVGHLVPLRRKSRLGIGRFMAVLSRPIDHADS